MPPRPTRGPGRLIDGAVPGGILADLRASAAEHDLPGAGPRGNLTPGTREGFNGQTWPPGFFDASEAAREIIGPWARWARTTMASQVGLDTIATARARDGTSFPEAVLCKADGVDWRADSAHHEFVGTELDLGAGATQWTMLTFCNDRPGAMGDLVIARPVAAVSGEPINTARPRTANITAVQPTRNRTVIFRSEYSYKIGYSPPPVIFVAMAIVVTADGLHAVAFG